MRDSSAPIARTLPRADRPWPIGLWPLALLLGEYLAISVHFDAKPLLASVGFAHGLGYLGLIAPLFVVVATAMYMLSGRALRGEIKAFLQTRPLAGPAQRIALIVNVACFAGVWLELEQLLQRAAEGVPSSPAQLLFFLLLAAGSGVSALAPTLPWRLLFRRAARVIVGGALVGVLGWAAGLATEQLWDRMQALTLYSVLALLVPFSRHVVFDPQEAVIGTENFMVQVAPECSGIEGIGLILVVMSVYLVTARARLQFPKALLLLPIAVAAVWICNDLRIALLIAVGVFISPEVALSGFHSKAGWLFFCAVALGLIAVVQNTRWLARAALQPTAAEEQGPSWSPAAVYLSPLMALIATSLATALFSTGFDRWYGLRIAAVCVALYVHRRHLPKPAWPPSLHAPLIGVVVFVLWLVLVPSAPPEHAAKLRADIAALGVPWAYAWLALRALGSSVTVPIAEELAFRGFLLRRLVAADFTEVDKSKVTAFALVASSIAFGALHTGAFVAATLAGIAYAFAQAVRGRIGDAIIAHAVTNALIAVDVLCFGAYGLWT
jgi:exosortase E/protease (VPEID-CTERM system)